MKLPDFYRKENKILHDLKNAEGKVVQKEVYEEFPSINAAKKKSRALQKAGKTLRVIR